MTRTDTRTLVILFVITVVVPVAFSIFISMLMTVRVAAPVAASSPTLAQKMCTASPEELTKEFRAPASTVNTSPNVARCVIIVQGNIRQLPAMPINTIAAFHRGSDGEEIAEVIRLHSWQVFGDIHVRGVTDSVARITLLFIEPSVADPTAFSQQHCDNVVRLFSEQYGYRQLTPVPTACRPRA
jgi:hypothetical protein